VSAFQEATLADLLAFLAPRLTVPRRLYRHLVAQMSGGPVWVVRRTPDGPPLAIGGVFRFGDERPGQVWFICQPEVGALLAGVAGRARAALAEAREAGPIVAIVRTKAGGRMARALGFEFVALADTDREVWRM
jgi:hypothetical protein